MPPPRQQKLVVLAKHKVLLLPWLLAAATSATGSALALTASTAGSSGACMPSRMAAIQKVADVLTRSKSVAFLTARRTCVAQLALTLDQPQGIPTHKKNISNISKAPARATPAEPLPSSSHYGRRLGGLMPPPPLAGGNGEDDSDSGNPDVGIPKQDLLFHSTKALANRDGPDCRPFLLQSAKTLTLTPRPSQRLLKPRKQMPRKSACSRTILFFLVMMCLPSTRYPLACALCVRACVVCVMCVRVTRAYPRAAAEAFRPKGILAESVLKQGILLKRFVSERIYWAERYITLTSER